MKNYIIDYNKAAYADTILWTDEENSIKALEPFIDFIRCDLDGEDYAFLYSDEKEFSVLEEWTADDDYVYYGATSRFSHLWYGRFSAKKHSGGVHPHDCFPLILRKMFHVSSAAYTRVVDQCV